MKVVKEGTVHDCGGNSGQWRLTFLSSGGTEQLIGTEKLTYYKYVITEYTVDEAQPDGSTISVTYLSKSCAEFEENGAHSYSDCPSPGGLVIEPK